MQKIYKLVIAALLVSDPLRGISTARLKSKEPPQTFVPKILVAYICSFKGLHQPKTCQNQKNILKLSSHIIYGLTSWTYEFG